MSAVRPPSLGAAIAYMSTGEGGLAVAELRALSATPNCPLGRDELHYWLGLAYLLAFDWGGVTYEMRAYLSSGASDWRAGWACLHLGRAFERAGHTDEASLAYRGCLSIADSERARPQARIRLDDQARRDDAHGLWPSVQPAHVVLRGPH